MSLGYRWSKPYVSLEHAIVTACQQALKGYGVKHPDSKRTRRAKLRAKWRRRNGLE